MNKQLFFIAIVSFLFWSTIIFSQTKYERRISISEWVNEMKNCRKPVYMLKNTEIYADFKTDSRNRYTVYFGLQKGSLNIDTITIKARVDIVKCKFPDLKPPLIINLQQDFQSFS